MTNAFKVIAHLSLIWRTNYREEDEDRDQRDNQAKYKCPQPSPKKQKTTRE